MLDGLVAIIVPQDQVVTVLRQYLKFKFLAFHLGCVTKAKVCHGTIGHHDVLAAQAFVVTGQMGTQ